MDSELKKQITEGFIEVVKDLRRKIADGDATPTDRATLARIYKDHYLELNSIDNADPEAEVFDSSTVPTLEEIEQEQYDGWQ